MKKEDLQNSQKGTGSAENKGENRDQQRNQTRNVLNTQRDDMAQQAGLGRDRLTDIEDLGGINGRDDYAGTNMDDLSNKDLNAANDQ
jgi:hypothetical protein